MIYRNIIIISRKELRESFRDKRTLFLTYLVPFGLGLVIFGLFLALPNIFKSTMAPSVVFEGLFHALPLMSLGGILYLSLDITTGERERNTIETLFTLCVSREEVIFGKYIALVIFSLSNIAAIFSSILGAYFTAILVSGNSSTYTSGDYILRWIFTYWVIGLYYALIFSSTLLLIGLRAPSVKRAGAMLNVLIMAVILAPTAIHLSSTLHIAAPERIAMWIPIINCGVFATQFLQRGIIWWEWIALAVSLFVGTALTLFGAIRIASGDSMIITKE
jgi:ABC-type Na+ efflux pump permease subunit